MIFVVTALKELCCMYVCIYTLPSEICGGYSFYEY